MPKEWVSMEFDDGAIFFLDYLQRQLRELGNPTNVIRLADMLDKGTHYEFLYDPATTNIAREGMEAGQNETDPYRVKIMPMSQWNIGATAHIFRMEEQAFKGLTDQEFFKLPYVAALKEVTDKMPVEQVSLLEERLKGVLPQLTIGHEQYEVDWERKCLHGVDGKRINLNAMDMNVEGTEYVCLYNQRLGIVADPKFQQQHYPDLVKLSIPYELKLDPVGVARQYGMKDYELLGKYPLAEKLEAKFTPVLRERQKQSEKPKQQKGLHRKGRRI